MKNNSKNILKGIICSSNKVYRKTCISHPELIFTINESLNVLRSTDSYVYKLRYGDTWPDSDIISYNYAEIESSILLALSGYYHNAIANFRIVLDTSLKLLYFEDDVSSEILWERDPVTYGKKIRGDLIKEFFYWDQAFYYDAHTGFESEIREYKKHFNLYIHPGGPGVRIIPREGKPAIVGGGVYSKELFLEWCTCYLFIIKFLCVCILLMQYDSLLNRQKSKLLLPFKKYYPMDWDLIVKGCKFQAYIYEKYYELSNGITDIEQLQKIKINLTDELKTFDTMNQ